MTRRALTDIITAHADYCGDRAIGYLHGRKVPNIEERQAVNMDYQITDPEELIVETKKKKIPASTAVKLLRDYLGLNRMQFCEKYGIPYRTVQDWEAGKRVMPQYVFSLLIYKVKYDELLAGHVNIAEAEPEAGRG